MSAVGHGLVFACGDCAGPRPLPETHPLTVIVLIAVLTVTGAAIVMLRRRRRSSPLMVTDQWSTLSVMGELCPEGWRAEITLNGSQPEPAAGRSGGAGARVALQWTLFEGEDEVAVTRRVWAASIDDALQTMVDDRRLDVALEQIEQSAAHGGDQL